MQNPYRHLVKHPIIWQIALVCYWSALFAATHLPVEMPIALPGHWTDKVVHLAAFAILAVLLAITWQLGAGQIAFRHLWWLWVLLVLYGAIDEWTQAPVGRQASVWDWLADALGAAIGLALFATLRRWNTGAPRAAAIEARSDNRTQ